MSHQAVKDTKDSSKASLEADSLFNKHVFRTLSYGAAGFGVGLAGSLLFFKHKVAMTALCTGLGAGYGISGAASDWQNYRKYKNLAKSQGQQGQQGSGRLNFDESMFKNWSKDEVKQAQQKDEHRQDWPAQSKSDNQGQQRHDQQKQDHKSDQGKQNQSQQGQQSKQQSGKEQPMNIEAKEKQDIANQREGQEPKMGEGPKGAQTTQDKGKRQEQATYSQTMQGTRNAQDDVQRGEKGPQNTSIPPSERDWKGGHANQGVNQQQVHRGKAEDDKMGKSPRPDHDPKNVQEKGPGKQENQALSGVDLKGQHLQTFQSNQQPMGKAGLTHEIKKDYQQGRNRSDDPDLDNQRRQIHGMEQDRMGQSVKEGNNIRVKEQSDTAAGVGNYRPGVAEQNTKNQVNAVLE